MTRLLVLTAGFGEGHNAAARACAEAWEERHGPGTAPVADVHALAAPALNAWVRRAYLRAINRSPRVWRAIYGWLDRSEWVTSVMARMPAERRVLRTLLARERPAALCCTFPGYAFLLRALAAEGECPVPFYNVVTDSISLNSLWWRAGAAGWFVPNSDSAAVMQAAGVDPVRVHVSGFPVRAEFRRTGGRLVPPDLAAGAMPRVLQVINSGTRGAEETAERLLRETRWEITCTVGRDERLRDRLLKAAEHRREPATILGWTHEIPRLLLTHHAVVSKAGGATTQEALAARCPMIVNQIVPGQEEGNYELLRRHGIGAHAETPAAVLAALEEAFADRGRRWRQWRDAIAPLHRPEAALAIADRIAADVRQGPGRRSQPEESLAV
jgi:processive 1,2-diacylglycerol beta-glucosyltransferase